MWVIMKALVYISQAEVEFSQDGLVELAVKAAAHNASVGITGYLWFQKNQFIGNSD